MILKTKFRKNQQAQTALTPQAASRKPQAASRKPKYKNERKPTHLIVWSVGVGNS